MERVPSLEDCIKLLKGERDEQRLAGLLLATKFCNKDDHDSILRVYDAVGDTFLDRLLRTGMGKGIVGGSGNENQDAYLKLAVTILAAFCRVPKIAASKEMAAKVPLVLEIISKESGSSLLEECFEILLLVTTTQEDGAKIFCESGGMDALASQMPTLPGTHTLELAMRLLQLIISTIPLHTVSSEYSSELSIMISALAKQFALLHNAMKFEALHLLSAILSSAQVAPLHDSLRSMNDTWPTYVRVGTVAILQNRVAPKQKLEALVLAESVISIVGEQWLIGPMQLHEIQDFIPADRCILLVLESSRVEIAVLLNDLAYLKYEKPSSPSSDSETVLLKQRNLGIAFSLVEKIIKLISNVAEDEGTLINENMFTKIISGLNETVDLILEYLRDAKDHGHNQGNDLLASVRIVGSYLAEAPFACKDNVMDLLEYMVSIKGEDERSPCSSICFLLPMLCQITMEIEGCKLMASSGVYKEVVDYLVKLLGVDSHMLEGNGPIFLACDTILNLLLKRKQTGFPLDDSYFIRLLVALSSWAEHSGNSSDVMMASSISVLILDSTSEATLLRHPHFEHQSLISISQLIRRSLTTCDQDMKSTDTKEVADLLQIVVSGYSQWAHRFPLVKEIVER